MNVIPFRDDMLADCAEFWWDIYRHRPYVHRPDGYDWSNGSVIGPHIFARHLQAGLSSAHTAHWHGEVSGDSIFVAVDGGQIKGILVSSVDGRARTGTILSGFIQTDGRARPVGRLLLDTALDHFCRLHLSVATAGTPTKAIEVDSPIYLALRDSGFAWDTFRWPDAGYGVLLGGSLEGFELRPEIRERIDRLRQEGIDVIRCTPEEAWEMRYYHSGEKVGPREGPCPSDVRAVALHDGLVVGHAAASTGTHWAEEPPNGRIWGEAIPLVLPAFRNRGIGKVLYHLAVEWLVKEGASHTHLATGLNNPAQFIYRSTPLQLWYTSISGMSKHLR